MVDFKQMPPVDLGNCILRLKQLTKLQNGAKFEFVCIAAQDGNYSIHGRYLDYAGEWCEHVWDKFGRVKERRFAEMDIDWQSYGNA